MPQVVIDRIVAAGVVRPYAAGQYLFHADDAPDAVFQMLSGRVKLWRLSPAGDPLTLAYRTAGTFLGYPVIHQCASHTVNATADTDLTALVWSGSQLSLFVDEPLIQRNALAVVTGQMHRLIARIEEQRSASVETRLARALCKILSEIGERRETGEFCVPVTRQELADYAGVTLHTASRAISRWTKAGVLRPSRGRIIIDDVTPIAQCADET